MPTQFDENGLGKFASDSLLYQEDVISLTDKLRNDGVIPWFQAVAPLHVKFYSLSHFLFSPLTAPNILTIEPLNLVYYLAILAIVNQLALTLFNRVTGVLAMTVLALWPSFLLHTTQLLRDPLLIVAILVLVLVIADWLNKDSVLRGSLLATLAAAFACATVWMVRLAMWDVVRLILLMGVVLLVIRSVRDRRFFPGPVISVVVLSAVILLIPHWGALKSQQRREADAGRTLIADQAAELSLWKRIGRRRQAFADLKKDDSYASASNIDNEVTLNTMSDLVRYLPRAAAIGFFAPFPNMWFAEGSQVGRAGRLVSGLETLITYVIELLALVGLWQMRKSLAVWLLAFTVILGLTGLGFTVLNIGSLYRFRYPFLALMIVLAAGGIGQVLSWRAIRNEPSTRESTVAS